MTLVKAAALSSEVAASSMTVTKIANTTVFRLSIGSPETGRDSRRGLASDAQIPLARQVELSTFRRPLKSPFVHGVAHGATSVRIPN